jgi:hypothetical protein
MTSNTENINSQSGNLFTQVVIVERTAIRCDMELGTKRLLLGRQYRGRD